VVLFATYLETSVDLAVATQAAGGSHKASSRDHEVEVGMKVIESFQLRDDSGQKVADLLVSARGSELGQPDRLAIAGLVSLLKQVEEGISSSGRGIPVNIAEVNLAAANAVTSGEKFCKPRDTFTRATAVGDGRGTNQSLASKRVHELNVGSGTSLGGHVGLASIIGLVKAE